MSQMYAACYKAPRQFDIISVPIPQISADQVLLKVTCCGICGSDKHLAEGASFVKFPLIPGHEIVGIVWEVGSAVNGLAIGDRCVADNTVFCESCFHCRRGQQVLCENLDIIGVTIQGGFSEYVAVNGNKLYKINNLTDEEATLIEPASAAIHGIDRLNPSAGIDALVLGAGPSGLIIAQLLKLNGASKVVIAANSGIKMDIARKLEVADEYIDIDRNNSGSYWTHIDEKYSRGFDVVVEATASEEVVNRSISFVRRGGTLVLYGLYSNSHMVHWSPAKIFQDEIKIIGTFTQANCFSRSIAYLESGKIKVKGMVTDVFAIRDFDKALEKMNNKTACKIMLRP